MCLTSKLAHQEPSLVVGKSEPLHLSLRRANLCGCHRLPVFTLLFVFIAVVLIVEDKIIVLLFTLLYIATVVGGRWRQP